MRIKSSVSYKPSSFTSTVYLLEERQSLCAIKWGRHETKPRVLEYAHMYMNIPGFASKCDVQHCHKISSGILGSPLDWIVEQDGTSFLQ